MEWWTCVVLLCVTAVLADDGLWTVTLAQGRVSGRKHPSGELYEFYNIPYATGPTGLDKFKPPLPPPTWTETFDATSETRIVCPQNEEVMSGMMPEHQEVKEDCLIANVFVPVTTKGNLPVFVYVHGGAFIAGYGAVTRGSQFMKVTNDFIIVTFNYRVGIHGFLCLGTEDVPGNAGMKDQVALLRWVRDNIASFGGNPYDVTLAGCSAGSAAVDLLMISKAAEGLFHRVIPESGGNLAAFTIQRDPYENARTYARQLNELAMVDNLQSLEQFYKASSIDLLTRDNLDQRTDSTFYFSPCVERDTPGAFLTESPLSILKRGDYKQVPILYGFANMEGLLRIGFYELWKDKMNEKFSDFLPADLTFASDAEREEVANRIKTFYFGQALIGNDNILKYVDFFSDVLMTYPMLRAAKLYVENGNNQVYLYEYSFVDENVWPVPHTDGVRGATHTAQSAAWMNGGDSSNETPEHQKMRATIRKIWHNFLRTGNPVPQGSSLPAWPAAGALRFPWMDLNENLTLHQSILLDERTRFWDDIYDRYYLDAIPPRSGASSMAPKNIFHLFFLYILFYVTKRIVVG